jgi:hypothetical protein
LLAWSLSKSRGYGSSLVGLLRQGVELGNGVVESLLGEVTSSVGRVEDLVAASQCLSHTVPTKHVLEDGEVECETQSDGMRRGELGNGNVGSGLVCLEGLVGRVLSLVASGELGEVSVVVSHPSSQKLVQRVKGRD